MKNSKVLVGLLAIVLIGSLFVLARWGKDNHDKKENNSISESNKIVNKAVEQNETESENTSSSSNTTEKKDEENKDDKTNSSSNNTKTQEVEKKDGYDINISKKDITIEKGKEDSFEITFTNPDESSIREYIHCEDLNDIIGIRYSPIVNKRITVYVEALKAGETEILVCDFNYPDKKEIVKVNVVE